MTRVEENKETIRIIHNEEIDIEDTDAINAGMIVLLADISKSLAIQADAAVEANKIVKGMDEVPTLVYEIFGTPSADEILESVSVSEAMQKIKEYEERRNQTDAPDMNDGSIKVGDEVRLKGSDPVRDDCDYGICTRSLPNINTMYVMRRDGSSGEENKDEWHRTGRKFPQIAEVLEQLRGEK